MGSLPLNGNNTNSGSGGGSGGSNSGKMPSILRDFLNSLDDEEWKNELYKLLQSQSFNQVEVDLFELLCKVLDQNLFAQVDWARNSFYFRELEVSWAELTCSFLFFFFQLFFFVKWNWVWTVVLHLVLIWRIFQTAKNTSFPPSGVLPSFFPSSHATLLSMCELLAASVCMNCRTIKGPQGLRPPSRHDITFFSSRIYAQINQVSHC